MRFDYRKTKEGTRRFNNPNIYRATFYWQKILHFLGVAWHNSYSNECTSDFNCCEPSIGRKSWLRIVKKCCVSGDCGICPNCRIES